MRAAAKTSQAKKRATNRARDKIKKPTLKVCGNCSQKKSWREFTEVKQNNDGLHSWCKQCLAEWARNKRLSDLAAASAVDKKYKQANREKINKAARERYRNKSPEQKAEIYESRRESLVVNVHRRRARLKNAGGEFNKQDVLDKKREQDYLCALCDKPLGTKYHVDHKIPLSKGGSNGPENIQITHAFCNLSKGSKII